MQFIKPGINLDFVGKRKIAFGISLTMILITIISLTIHKGPKYGIDFAGGTLTQIKFTDAITTDEIKNALSGINLGAYTVQSFGDATDNEFLVRIKKSDEDASGLGKLIQEALNAEGYSFEIRRSEMVGPAVGDDLREKALLSMFFALLFITVYISGRFELKWTVSIVITVALAGVVYFLYLFDVPTILLIPIAFVVALVLFYFLDLKYAMGAIVALVHDVLITVGLFSIFDKEFTLAIIAALLTIIGYSLNDTIIVFDRIRENLKKAGKTPISQTVNSSINETLGRTILTSLTTFMVVVTLFIFGGGIIHDFAFAMIVGVIVGTYSSVFVASPILLIWQKRG